MPSRVSAFGDPRINARLPASRGLSQAAASFVASRCQDIRRTPFLSLATPTEPPTISLSPGCYHRAPGGGLGARLAHAPSRGPVPPGDGPIGGHTIRQKGARRRRPQPVPDPRDARPDGKTMTRAGAGKTHALSGDVFISGRRRGFTRNYRPTPRLRRPVPALRLARDAAVDARDSLANKP